eukprot:121991_1
MAEMKFEYEMTDGGYWERTNNFTTHHAWLVIRGCTDLNKINVLKKKGIKVSYKEGTKGGKYLNGMACDVYNMEKMIQKQTFTYFKGRVSSPSLRRKMVLNEIKALAQMRYTTDDRIDWVYLYYTGHGQTNTGNWVVSDGVICFEEIVSLIIKGGKRCVCFKIFSDCCYSGNWVLDFQKYVKNNKLWPDMTSSVYAACYPGKSAYDDPNKGGYLTRCLDGGDTHGAWLSDKKQKRLKLKCVIGRYERSQKDVEVTYYG